MKKMFALVILLLASFLLTACNQDAISETLTSAVNEPTAIPVDHGSPPLQVVLYSFEDLKTLASFIDADSEDIQDYYNQHKLRTSDPVKAVRLCSEKLDIRIPFADRFEDFSIEQIHIDAGNFNVWYHIGDYRYLFYCYSDNNKNLEMREKARMEYESNNILYRSETPEKIIYAYAFNQYNPDSLYRGRIIMKDANIIVWILRDIDEDTGEYKDGGNPNVDLTQLEKFDFVIARDLLDQME